MFFNGWLTLLRTVIVGVLAYAALIVFLRLSGKRVLSKWNAFDFVVTIAIGSILATALLSQTTSLAQGLVAFAVLVSLQFIITWASVRSGVVRNWIKARPTLLLDRGNLLTEALKRERVTEGEVRAAVRARGHASLADVDAVILETDGSFSVIGRIGELPPSALQDVDGYPRS
ncbi:MAG: YetF domain-containing protein [Acidobacteriota bacterium]